MKNPFEGKAVKFETKEQLDHLAELARGYGLIAVGCNFNLLTHRHFREHFDGKEYSNYRGKIGLHEIHYSDFVASIEGVKFTETVNKTVDNILVLHEESDTPDMVNHPKHYNVKGFEVIDIIDSFNLNFNMGNALKYLLRANRKGNKVQDLQKAIWYLQREINTK